MFISFYSVKSKRKGARARRIQPVRTPLNVYLFLARSRGSNYVCSFLSRTLLATKNKQTARKALVQERNQQEERNLNSCPGQPLPTGRHLQSRNIRKHTKRYSKAQDLAKARRDTTPGRGREQDGNHCPRQLSVSSFHRSRIIASPLVPAAVVVRPRATFKSTSITTFGSLGGSSGTAFAAPSPQIAMPELKQKKESHGAGDAPVAICDHGSGGRGGVHRSRPEHLTVTSQVHLHYITVTRREAERERTFEWAGGEGDDT